MGEEWVLEKSKGRYPGRCYVFNNISVKIPTLVKTPDELERETRKIEIPVPILWPRRVNLYVKCTLSVLEYISSTIALSWASYDGYAGNEGLQFKNRWVEASKIRYIIHLYDDNGKFIKKIVLN